MKTDNQYLREIAKNFGVDVPSEHKPSNWYLKKIKEALEDETNDDDVELDWELSGSLVNRIVKLSIPNGVTSLPSFFTGSFQNVKEVTVPSTVTTIETGAFPKNSSYKLEKVNLNWTENPVTYTYGAMAIRTGAVFTIPKGTTSIYENASYPSELLVERNE